MLVVFTVFKFTIALADVLMTDHMFQSVMFTFKRSDATYIMFTQQLLNTPFSHLHLKPLIFGTEQQQKVHRFTNNLQGLQKVMVKDFS